MKKTRKAVAHLRVSSIASPGPILPQAAVRRYMSGSVSPATGFQINNQFSEENQGFPVPASVRSVAFPSADGNSICRTSTACKNQRGFAQLIHHCRWIRLPCHMVAGSKDPCTGAGRHRCRHECCGPPRHRRCETAEKYPPHCVLPAGLARQRWPHSPFHRHCWIAA